VCHSQTRYIFKNSVDGIRGIQYFTKFHTAGTPGRTPVAAAGKVQRLPAPIRPLPCCGAVTQFPLSLFYPNVRPYHCLYSTWCAFVRLSDCPVTMCEYEERLHQHAYTTTSSSSWYGHDVRRPMTWCNMAEMTYSARSSSSYPVHPVPVDYSAAPDAAAAAAAGSWSLVDLKPCMTPCGLSTYTGTLQL